MGLRSLICAAALVCGMASMAAADDVLPPGVPYASPTDPVRIASIALPSDTVHGGDVATATVLTTSNAAALTARVGTYLINVPKTAPGTFAVALKVPRLPFPSYRAHIVVTAIRADGETSEQTISIKIKY